MTKDEALALALEALEKSIDDVRTCLHELRFHAGYPKYDRQIAAYSEQIAKHEAAITAIKQAQEPVDTEYFGLEPWERDKPISPTSGMNIAQRILHVGGRNNEAGYVEFGSIQAVEALVRQVLRDLPEPKQEKPNQG